jgi:hypothetical protein
LMRCLSDRSKFCSYPCRHLSDKGKPAHNRQNITSICSGCGCSYPTKKSLLSTTRWCSRKCRHDHESKEVTCATCLKPFRVKQSKMDATYCSRTCKDGHPSVILCRNCGCFFLIKPFKKDTARYCSRYCTTSARTQQYAGKSFDYRFKAVP